MILTKTILRQVANSRTQMMRYEPCALKQKPSTLRPDYLLVTLVRFSERRA